MQTSILKYLEESTDKYPDKIAVIDERDSLSYRELLYDCKCIGSGLAVTISDHAPVGIYMEKSADALCAFLGTVYAGGCYSFLNPELPDNRLRQILSVLQPCVIITTGQMHDMACRIFEGVTVLDIEELKQTEPAEDRLRKVEQSRIDLDPLYINFTSGSTGVPKGIVVGQRSVIDFIDCFTELFHITEDDRIANQAPFDFDVSVKDIYSCLKAGATLVIVPRRLFSAPTELLDYLTENRVTTLIWAVSALYLITTFHGLDYKVPETVNKILFSGEVMPYKTLMDFKKHLPDAMYVNLYGPTEVTCNCTYHILEAERDYSDGIPIGTAFPNEDVFLLDTQEKRVEQPGTIGEICVRGTALALGYYNAPEQNEKHFTANPWNTAYPERIYRTGDLGKYNEKGELLFSGRKDFQIKYLGHRIELEEIEREMAKIDGVERCCCLFDEKHSRLKGIYTGAVEKGELHRIMKEKLPVFMVPGVLMRVEEMPMTKNGKIDRKLLTEMTGRRKGDK